MYPYVERSHFIFILVTRPIKVDEELLCEYRWDKENYKRCGYIPSHLQHVIVAPCTTTRKRKKDVERVGNRLASARLASINSKFKKKERKLRLVNNFNK